MKKTKRKPQNKTAVTVFFLLAAGVLLVWGFFKIASNKQNETRQPLTEVETLLKKDIEGNYPGTPREVLKLYCRITKCLYNEEMTQKEFEQMALKLRFLFDEELLANNPEASFIRNLKNDVDSYHEEEKRISSYDVQLASDMKLKTIKKVNYATLKINILVQGTGKNRDITKTTEEFLLREDEAGKYKIAHWQITDGTQFE